MNRYPDLPLRRREFVASLAAGAASTQAAWAGPASSGKATEFKAGEGTADITPPLGIELGGFHRAPGNERRVQGIRQRSFVRAIVMEYRGTQVAIISLDVCGLGHAMATRLRKRIAVETGIPADNIRLCATHTHSTPGFIYLRQWGAISQEYMATVEQQVVQAVGLAKQDLAAAEVSLGKTRATGASFNRTTDTWKTDAAFTAASTDAERWLDTMLHVLHFERPGGRQDLLWYHFSAHPVCFADEMAGPDFPGMVADRLRDSHGLSPSLLQGHAGDVNPGDGTPWRGDAEETTHAVHDAISRALENTTRLNIDGLHSHRQQVALPLDMQLFANWLRQYRENPAECTTGHWVDARFAKAWYDDNVDRNLKQTTLDRTISSVRLGPVGLVFHPTELYSFYGLSVRMNSPAADTLVVGYTDGLTGYVADPTAYQTGDYGAFTVPKILDYPPYQPHAAEELTHSMLKALQSLFS